MRWRYGNNNPAVSKAVPTATLVEVGDLISQDASAADVVVPASEFTWDTNIATTQEAFHDEFLGVSGQQSQNGNVDGIRHNSRGVHEFDCASATFALGTLVGPAKATGNALENQKVVAVASENLAIGRVARDYSTATTTVHVEVFSVVHGGGVQAAA